jgi:transposase
MAKKEQRVFTQEFKREAVQLAETSGKSKTQIARDLGISDSALHAWRKQFAANGNQAFPGKGHQTELEEENRRLQRENDILKQEREVLKKAVRIFAQSQL